MKQEPAERLAYLKDLVAARTDMKGKPLSGYSGSVAMAREEIASIEKSIEAGKNG